MSPEKESSISTVVFIGTLLGANAWGAASDAFGRRAGFFATAVFAFIFGISSAFAPNFKVLSHVGASMREHQFSHFEKQQHWVQMIAAVSCRTSFCHSALNPKKIKGKILVSPLEAALQFLRPLEVLEQV